MKFIHCADLHLAAKMESRFTPEQAKKRREELFETFRCLADKATEEQVKAILISGDIFDEGKPNRSAKKRFIEIVKKHPEVDFLCLSGNHDESLAGEEDLPPNLHCFAEDWKCFHYENVDIWGVELSPSNCNLIYAAFRPEPEKINLVMLHGQISEYTVKPDEQTVVLPLLADKNIDYLALGHLHSYRKGPLDRRGSWCYAGCLEGRGYDECGQKGYVMLETGDHSVNAAFVPFANRTIHDIECDLTGAAGFYEIKEKICFALAEIDEKDLVRLRLTGSLSAEIQLHLNSLREEFSRQFFAVDIKNALKTEIDPEDYKDQLSLKGEFIRLVQSEDLPMEDKERIIRCGLLALQNEEVDEI